MTLRTYSRTFMAISENQEIKIKNSTADYYAAIYSVKMCPLGKVEDFYLRV